MGDRKTQPPKKKSYKPIPREEPDDTDAPAAAPAKATSVKPAASARAAPKSAPPAEKKTEKAERKKASAPPTEPGSRRAPPKPSPSRMMRAAEVLKATRRKTIEVELDWLEEEPPTVPRDSSKKTK